MPFTVRLAHQNKNFVVEDEELILDAALRQGVDIPHSCCEGICGSCEGQLIDGLVHYDNTEHLALNAEERAHGRALFCCSKARSDLLVDIPGCTHTPFTNIAEATYDLASLEPLNHNVFRAILSPREKALPYLAGQYIEICLEDEEPKPFSIANAPAENKQIELHIRCQNDNAYAKKLIDHLRHQHSLILRGPFGSCFYHPQPHMPTLLLAVGTGFAPLKAIIEKILHASLTHEVTLFWAAKKAEDIYQMELPQQWSEAYPLFRFVPVLSSEIMQTNWPGVYGNLLDIVIDYYPSLAEHHIYFGGNMQLTLDALDRFTAHGAQTCYMYSDVFDLL